MIQLLLFDRCHFPYLAIGYPSRIFSKRLAIFENGLFSAGWQDRRGIDNTDVTRHTERVELRVCHQVPASSQSTSACLHSSVFDSPTPLFIFSRNFILLTNLRLPLSKHQRPRWDICPDHQHITSQRNLSRIEDIDPLQRHPVLVSANPTNSVHYAS